MKKKNAEERPALGQRASKLPQAKRTDRQSEHWHGAG
jgi:hypothetical protein